MKKSDVDDALQSLWVLVREQSPLVIGSQSLHGKFPDLADTIMYSREIDIVLPNKSKLGNWLSDVVGDGTPFEVDRGYFIDHVTKTDGFPVLADGWELRAFRESLLIDGEEKSQASFLSPEDLIISKLAAARDKDFEFVQKLIFAGYVAIEDVDALVPSVPEKYRDVVIQSLQLVRASLRNTPRQNSKF